MQLSNRICFDDPILALRESREDVITNGLEVRIDPILATGGVGMPSAIEELGRNVSHRGFITSAQA